MSQNNTWVLSLSQELAKRTSDLKRDVQTPNEVMEQVYRLGLYALEYRREKNPKKAEQQKNQRTAWKIIQTVPAGPARDEALRRAGVGGSQREV